MRQVTKEIFYRTVGQLDVHPRVDGSTLRDEMHVSEWVDQRTHKIVGVSKTSSWGRVDRNEYFVEN